MKRLIYLSLIGLCLTTPAARANIFQWEYINPADPSQGKRQSTTLAPGGAGPSKGPRRFLYHAPDARRSGRLYATGFQYSMGFQRAMLCCSNFLLISAAKLRLTEPGACA